MPRFLVRIVVFVGFCGFLISRDLPTKVASAAPAAPPLSTVAPHLAGTNPFLNADILIRTDTPTFSNYSAEGWLHLATATSNGYVGTFIDNMAGGKIYRASATGTTTNNFDGTYTINTGNGQFTFTISNNGLNETGKHPPNRGLTQPRSWSG